MKRGRKAGVYNQYYKNKYMLVLYDFDDNLIQIFDNCHQLADYFDTTYDALVAGVGRVINGSSNYLKKGRKKYKLYAIEVDLDEK